MCQAARGVERRSAEKVSIEVWSLTLRWPRSINIYYTTRTVGTCLEHPRQGRTQLFRRGVSDALLKEILRDPRVHTPKGYQRRVKAPSASSNGADLAAAGAGGAGLSEEAAWDEHLRALEGEAAALQAEIAAVRAVRDELRIHRLVEEQALEQKGAAARRGLEDKEAEEKAKAEAHKKERTEAEEKARRERQAARERAEAEERERQRKVAERQQRKVNRGRHFLCQLGDDWDDFKARCGTADKFETVKCMTVMPEGYFISRDNGKSWWSRLPQGLANRLRAQDRFNTSDLQYVAEGSSDYRYYAELSNGEAWWSGGESDAFDACVRKNVVRRVAFGPDGSWIVLTRDSWAYEGIPKELHNKLRSRNPKLPGPVEVSLGTDAYFVRWGGDGMYDFHLPTAIAKTCNEDCQGNVTSVSFVSGNRYIVRFKKG